MTTQIIKAFDYNQLSTETRISLKARAEKINERTRRIAADIWENGRDFHEAQQELANHSGGTFLAWVETETGYGKSTVYRMIDVYKNISLPNLGKLDIATSALYLLAAPSTPDQARQEIIEAAQQGQPITYTKARQVIDGSKPAPTPEDMRPHVEKYIQGYSDRHGRRFPDLDNPSHTNSVFWRDITATFKAFNIPYAEAGLKLVIKQLRAQSADVPQETAEPFQVSPGEQQPQIREKLKAWISQSNASYDSIVRRLADKEASGHQYMMDMAAEALNTDGMFIWHAAMTLRNQLPEELTYATIHQLESLIRSRLPYATGERGKAEHHRHMLRLKAQGKNGEDFTDLSDWMEDQTTFRKNDLWQAAMNVTDQLTQSQLSDTAEPQPTTGVTVTLEYDSADEDEEDEPTPDPRIQQLRDIRWLLEEMSRNAGGDKKEVQFTYALHRACTALDGAAATLKQKPSN